MNCKYLKRSNIKTKILYAIASIFMFYSCSFLVTPSLQKLKDEYHHSSLQVPHIFLIDVETASINHFPESHWDNTDSITKMFVNELNNLDISIKLNSPITNRWSDSVWTKQLENYNLLPYRRLNKNYILGTVPYSDKPQLIPVLVYRHLHSADSDSRHHYVSIQIWAFIVENGELIYLKRSEESTKSIFYVNKNELDKSKIYTKGIWKRVVEDAMSDYLKNLKKK